MERIKVLLRRNVPKLGKIGQVVEVNPGYARNFLLPYHLAVKPTAGNTKAIEAEKQKYLEELTKMRGQLEAKAAFIKDKEITIHARANEEGHLYGSIGPAQIVAALAAKGIMVDVENIVLDSLIRHLDKYEVELLFGEDIKSSIRVWVVPLHEEGVSPPAEKPAADAEDIDAGKAQ